MTLQRGEDTILGFAPEATRGTAGDMTDGAWIPGRTPSGIAPVLEKVDIKETRGNKVTSTGSEITQKRVEGDLEFNVRAQSIGHIIRSLLGAVASQAKGSPNGAVTDHTMTILENDPEHPSFTIYQSAVSGQDYRHKLAIARKLDIDLVPNDLVKATVGLVAATEEENGGAAYAPTFSANDVHFRHQDVTIKLAANLAGLGAAQATKVKSLKLTIDNGGRPDQNVSELNPGNMLVAGFVIEGNFELDLQDNDLHDIYDGGEYQAMQISMVRSDVTIGSSANPGIVITIPKISIAKWTPNRPIDEVVRESIDFMAHNDGTNEPITVVITNLLTDYDPSSES